MSSSLLIYIGVVAVLWFAFMIRRRWRAGSKPRFGDADAYDGNLIIPSPGELSGTTQRTRGAHPGHITGHSGHTGSHPGHLGSHGHTAGPAGHGPTGGHH